MPDHYRRKYEEEFAKFKDACGARAFALGRHALALLLRSLDIQPDEKIGVCAFTCLAVVEGVKVCVLSLYIWILMSTCVSTRRKSSYTIRVRLKR